MKSIEVKGTARTIAERSSEQARALNHYLKGKFIVGAEIGKHRRQHAEVGKPDNKAFVHKRESMSRNIHRFVYIIKVDVADTLKTDLRYFLKSVGAPRRTVDLFVKCRMFRVA